MVPSAFINGANHTAAPIVARYVNAVRSREEGNRIRFYFAT
jgi:hypothetical protein